MAKGQFRTWVAHLLIAVFVPTLVAWPMPEHRADVAMFVSTVLLGIFVWRELRDRKKHIKAGIWGHYHMDLAGVTPPIDLWGDLLGPVAATLTYWCALWL